MASQDLIAKIRFFANKNGLNIEDYSEENILIREREYVRTGRKRVEFVRDILDEVSGFRDQRNTFGLSECPQCGGMTLIHEDGCMHCRSCGWSACG